MRYYIGSVCETLCGYEFPSSFVFQDEGDGKQKFKTICEEIIREDAEDIDFKTNEIKEITKEEFEILKKYM